ncbi:MAG: hypothetical protein NVSMB46_02600 [Candidatus Saccharimonadales bacterium]
MFNNSSVRDLIMKIGHIKLPHRFIAANNDYFAREQFYWDSYFIILGLLIKGDITLAKGMVDNLCWLFNKFGHIPAHNSWRSKWTTQPPLLSRMAWAVFESTNDKQWMSRVMSIVRKEYEQVWTSKQRLVPEIGLSMYRPRFLSKVLTVYESGWDVSSRFANGNLTIVPVDLNCYLYQYEVDLEKWAIALGNLDEASMWSKKKTLRVQLINKYLWDEKSGYYYDYNLSAKTHVKLKTMAGCMPLWAGISTQRQVAKTINCLRYFEQPYGMSATEVVPENGRQWDYPNGWAPLHYFLISGLRHYGYINEANRITKLWLNVQKKVFDETGVLWEKYDVVKGSVGKAGRYPTQPGFGWTNGVFICLLKELTKN